MGGSRITVLTEDTHALSGEAAEGRAWIPTAAVPDVLGWALRPEGLCRGDVCVPVRDRDAISRGEEVDVAALAERLGRPTVVDDETGTVAVGAPGSQRRAMLRDREAPEFALPDLAGRIRNLGEWGNRKRLLVAFASW